jgi:hypothetical protein
MELIDYETAITDSEKIKKIIVENIESLNAKQLQSILFFVRTVRQ